MCGNVLDLRTGEKVLFLGEGNFSFSLAVIKQLKQSNIEADICCTCFESEAVSDFAAENIEMIRQYGKEVFFAIDATKLDAVLESRCFDRIIFMFPHVGGKMKIQKNRELLRRFSESCAKKLTSSGEVIISLCSGQGGSDYDTERREEANTWQVVKMMSYGGFQAVEINRIDVNGWKEYKSHGYRSLAKEFRLENAVLHKFQLSIYDTKAEKRKYKLSFLCDKVEILKGTAFMGHKILQELQEIVIGMIPDCTCLEPDLFEGDDVRETIKEGLNNYTQIILHFTNPSDFLSNPFQILLVIATSYKKNLEKVLNLIGAKTITSLSTASILNLDELILTGTRALSWRHLWLSQPSLSPPKYSHDLSFWLPAAAACVARKDLHYLFWTVGGDFVIGLKVLEDSFTRNQRHSMTVRVEYCCLKFALSPDLVWNLHIYVLGGAIVKEFGAVLR